MEAEKHAFEGLSNTKIIESINELSLSDVENTFVINALLKELKRRGVYEAEES